MEDVAGHSPQPQVSATERPKYVSGPRRASPPPIEVFMRAFPEPIGSSETAQSEPSCCEDINENENPQEEDPSTNSYVVLPPESPPIYSGRFQYTKVEESQFRLIRIRPTPGILVCDILNVSVDSHPPYIALSYAWGEGSPDFKIFLNNRNFFVTHSLYAALEALRQKNETVTVWADAICINQEDTRERSEQVSRMTYIYGKATSVAIWLGPDADHSGRAVELLQTLYERRDSYSPLLELLRESTPAADVEALVLLFERPYWKRLWVVQEIAHARSIVVYCGSKKIPWSICKSVSRRLWHSKSALEYLFSESSTLWRGPRISLSGFGYSQVLTYLGPASLPDVASSRGLANKSLLEIMCACRGKLSADPRDKVFGLFGVLPAEYRCEFPVDYSHSVKEVYLDVVDYLLVTTDNLDVLCESIHFPPHTNSSINLPSWVPDWSHVPETRSLARSYAFSASAQTGAKYRFLANRNNLEISAIYIDTVKTHGVAVGTLCTIADYLMAFLNWRALILDANLSPQDDSMHVQEAFVRTISLDQAPPAIIEQSLVECYHVFATLMSERLPYIPLDRALEEYKHRKDPFLPESPDSYLQRHFGRCMMGRAFGITDTGRLCLGTGFMAVGDIVVVPLGCSTPILLRAAGTQAEYRFVGDVYVDTYMRGKAVEQWGNGEKELKRYVLH